MYGICSVFRVAGHAVNTDRFRPSSKCKTIVIVRKKFEKKNVFTGPMRISLTDRCSVQVTGGFTSTTKKMSSSKTAKYFDTSRGHCIISECPDRIGETGYAR